MRCYGICVRRTATSAISALSLMLVALGCSGARPDNPLVEMRERLHGETEYSVILADMKDDSGLFSTLYSHRYQVIIGEDLDTRGWTPVPEDVYRRYENFLGMTILSKTEDGEVTETPFPPGYQHVGNPKYGRWETNRSGESFWSFYGKYAMMSSLFNLGMGGRTVYRGDWDGYRRNSGQGRPYYGQNREYGTNGSFTKKSKPNFYKRKMAKQTRANESFRNKVDRRAGRSKTSYRSRAGGYGK